MPFVTPSTSGETGWPLPFTGSAKPGMDSSRPLPPPQHEERSESAQQSGAGFGDGLNPQIVDEQSLSQPPVSGDDSEQIGVLHSETVRRDAGHVDIRGKARRSEAGAFSGMP